MLVGGRLLNRFRAIRGAGGRSINQLGSRSFEEVAHRTPFFYFIRQNGPNCVLIHVQSFPWLFRADNITSVAQCPPSGGLGCPLSYRKASGLRFVSISRVA